MTICIHPAYQRSTDNRPEKADLPRETAQAIIKAIEHSGLFLGTILTGDHHCGSFALEVPPQLIQDLLLDLPELPELAQLVFERGLAEQRGISVMTNDNTAWGKTPQATIELHWNKMDDPSLDWCASHAAAAFRQIGVDFKDGVTIPAIDLKTKCEIALAANFNRDLFLILKVAEYAIHTQGPTANVEAY
jgi:hypothetical protein